MKKKLFFVVFIFLELMLLVLLTPTSTRAYNACTDSTTLVCANCDASKGTQPGKGQKACTYHCTSCGESNSGLPCDTPDWQGMEDCDVSGGGGGCPLNASKLTPALSSQCSSCIASKKQQTIRDIHSFGDSKNACSDLQVLSYWCNGGVSQDGVKDCNDVKNADCATATACGGSTSAPPLPAAQNLQARCSFEVDNLVNPTYINYTVNQTRGVGGARPTSLTQKYSLSGTVSGDGYLDVGEWTKDNVWVRGFRPGDEISISSPTNWLQVGYNVRSGNVTFSNTRFAEVLPTDKALLTATWNPVPESVAYVVRVNADPWDPWSPVDLGTYSGTTHIAPVIGTRDFAANTQGNTSTTYKAIVVRGLGSNLSVQGVRQGEAYPYKGQYAGVDFNCSLTAPTTSPPAPPVTSCSVSGDIDGNGRIELADFDKWKNAFVNGNPITNALHNCDGVAVDLVLFNTWRSQFARQ